MEEAMAFDILRWRHNKRYGVSNHQRLDGLLNRLFRRRSKKTSKLCVTGLCEGNSPVTGEFPSQNASNEGNVSIWWRHHAINHPTTSFSTWSLASAPHKLGPRFYFALLNFLWLYYQLLADRYDVFTPILQGCITGNGATVQQICNITHWSTQINYLQSIKHVVVTELNMSAAWYFWSYVLYLSFIWHNEGCYWLTAGIKSLQVYTFVQLIHSLHVPLYEQYKFKCKDLNLPHSDIIAMNEQYFILLTGINSNQYWRRHCILRDLCNISLTRTFYTG